MGRTRSASGSDVSGGESPTETTGMRTAAGRTVVRFISQERPDILIGAEWLAERVGAKRIGGVVGRRGAGVVEVVGGGVSGTVDRAGRAVVVQHAETRRIGSTPRAGSTPQATIPEASEEFCT